MFPPIFQQFNVCLERRNFGVMGMKSLPGMERFTSHAEWYQWSLWSDLWVGATFCPWNEAIVILIYLSATRLACGLTDSFYRLQHKKATSLHYPQITPSQFAPIAFVLFFVISSTSKLTSISWGSDLGLCESDLTFGWSELTWSSDLTMERNDRNLSKTNSPTD